MIRHVSLQSHGLTTPEPFTVRAAQWYLLAFVLLFAGPLLLLITFLPQVISWYQWQFEIPELEQRLGFRMGMLPSTDGCGKPFQLPGIVAVVPGGAFDAAGVKPGDIPWYPHGISDFVRDLQWAEGSTTVIHLISREALGKSHSKPRDLVVVVPPRTNNVGWIHY